MKGEMGKLVFLIPFFQLESWLCECCGCVWLGGVWLSPLPLDYSPASFPQLYIHWAFPSASRLQACQPIRHLHDYQQLEKSKAQGGGVRGTGCRGGGEEMGLKADEAVFFSVIFQVLSDRVDSVSRKCYATQMSRLLPSCWTVVWGQEFEGRGPRNMEHWPFGYGHKYLLKLINRCPRLGLGFKMRRNV